MKFEIVSVKLGKSPIKVLNTYPGINDFKLAFNKYNEDQPLTVELKSLDELQQLIKATKNNCFICHDENTIHIYDEKFR